MSLFLFVSPREIILLLFVSIPLVVLFQVQCPHLKKKVSSLLYFWAKMPLGKFSPVAGCLLCILPSQGGVGRRWWPDIFWEINPRSYLWMIYIVRKIGKNPRQGHWGKDSKIFCASQWIQILRRNLPCHPAFYFLHQKSCLLKRRGHLFQFCTAIQSDCTNCYRFSSVNVCRDLFLFVTLSSLTCSPSAVCCCQLHWKPSSEDISLEWVLVAIVWSLSRVKWESVKFKNGLQTWFPPCPWQG